jgi:hypothetical protein
MATIKLSKAQWEMIGTKAGWMKKAAAPQAVSAAPQPQAQPQAQAKLDPNNPADAQKMTKEQWIQEVGKFPFYYVNAPENVKNDPIMLKTLKGAWVNMIKNDPDQYHKINRYAPSLEKDPEILALIKDKGVFGHE